MIDEERVKLEQIAGLTAQQAKDELVRVMEDEARIEAAHIVKRIEDEAREQASRQAQRIIGMAVQRAASDYVVRDHRLGRHAPQRRDEGADHRPRGAQHPRLRGGDRRRPDRRRHAGGGDPLGLRPFRREIARVALERLIVDGRIHPARIEEIVEKVKAEMEQKILAGGRGGAAGAGHPGHAPRAAQAARAAALPHLLRPERAPALARRSPSWPAPWPPSSRPNVAVARRGGLLHDIGKAIDHEMEGTHPQIGIDLLRKYGETEEVVHAMACHHGDYDPQTVRRCWSTAADALSAARPGARREMLETYVKRLEELEEIASQLPGRAEDLRHPGRPRDPRHRRQRQDRRRPGRSGSPRTSPARSSRS